MKRFLLMLTAMLFFSGIASAQELVNGFDVEPDSSFWHHEIVDGSDTTQIVVTYTDEQVQDGAMSMRLDWTVQASQGWGGFANITHSADSSEFFDWSGATHISVWYYVAAPSSEVGAVELRLLLHEGSDDPNDPEYWYSHHKILDITEPGWNELKFELRDIKSQNESIGFWQPGWAGAGGNAEFNPDKIVAYKFEFSIDGSLHNASDPGNSGTATGTIYFDNLRVVGHTQPVLNFFDTAGADAAFTVEGTGTSAVTVTDNSENTVETASAQIDWKVDADQGWGGFVAMKFGGDEFLPDMSGNTHLSLWYNNLVASDQPGNVVFRLQLHEYSEGDDQDEVWFYENNVMLDTTAGWHKLLIPLEDRGIGGAPNAEGFNNPQWGGALGNSVFDLDKIKEYEIAFSAAQQGTISQGTLLLDNFELAGYRETDLIGPVAVEGITAAPDNYFNLVIWQDVPGESDEKYDVYASTEEIVEITDPNVEQIAYGVARGIQVATHYINYPLVDTSVDYYYAVRATDKAKNPGEVGYSDGAVTNMAKGVPTVSLTVPTNFVADGDFTEWTDAGIQPFVFKQSDTHIAIGEFDNDDDLTATVYIAVDNEYLYFAADVIDNVFSFEPAGDWWLDDAIEMWFGLFDSRTGQKSGRGGGEFPDYSIAFKASDLDGTSVKMSVDSSDYHFEGFNPDWVMEARVKIADLQAEGDTPFVPVNGMRIPIDIAIHDADANNVRDGVLSFSPLNMDNSWQSPRNWSYTWIGDQFVPTSVEENTDVVPAGFALNQNYPNPFNPETTISYSLPTAENVKVVLYNMLGQKVQTLLQSQQPAGTHKLTLNASNLVSGVYFYSIQAGNYKQTKKMVLMK
ncbi:MAG: T9SS C-terminal target domain-containing protein [Calditrichaeota bacterium]|nr:MAG: T9SS C-terminal target domain-containing protein [Calditrichota bacterium]